VSDPEEQGSSASPKVEKRPPRRRLKIGLLVAAALLVPPAGLVGYAGFKLRATMLRTNPAPEAATGLRTVKEVRTRKWMVVAAHPEAARVGDEVLRDGGTALDAAIAVQATLTLVEPQSSGIGGGAFLLYYDARSATLHAYDGRETAPRSATPQLFLDGNGKPMTYPVALVGGRSVGVPGVLRMLALAHGAHGRLAWARLFDGAVALAEEGFSLTPRLQIQLRLDPVLPTLEAPRAYFFGADGWPRPVGSRLKNLALAETLRAIAKGGAAAFYTGAIARDIESAVRTAKQPTKVRAVVNLVAHELGVPTVGTADVPAGGGLSVDDLAAYRRAASRRRALLALRCSRSSPSSSASTCRSWIRNRPRQRTCLPRPSGSPTPTATGGSPTPTLRTCPRQGSCNPSTCASGVRQSPRRTLSASPRPACPRGRRPTRDRRARPSYHRRATSSSSTAMATSPA
jgi:hypothetical protein